MSRIGIERWVVAAFGAVLGVAIVAPVAGRVVGWLAALTVIAGAAATPWIARALPHALAGAWRRRRWVSLLWVISAVIAVLQMGRLSAFMADSSRTWGATVPEPLSANHQCMPAYVYAADLSRRGDPNLYDARHYPLFDPPSPTCRVVSTPVRGLAPWVSDPYEYPPPFLLLPRAALAMTSSFDAIRAGWFVIQALALIGAFVGLAVWVGGSAGLTIGLLLPALLASLETMFNFQFGQFHAMAMLLACAGMIAFHSRRAAWGGALLAAAILAKLFPAILLVILAARREWRALAWTTAFGAGYAVLGFVVLGPHPYQAFIGYQVPRLLSGAAFEFTHLGNHAVFLISRNVSIAGLVPKLTLLGAPAGVLTAARILTWLYTLGLLVLTVALARGERTRVGYALLWIGVLNLAAMRSPMAPSAYVLGPVLWLVMLLATRTHGSRAAAAALTITWVLVVGPPPLPDRVEVPVGLVFQAIAIAVCIVAVAWVVRFETASSRAKSGSRLQAVDDIAEAVVPS